MPERFQQTTRFIVAGTAALAVSGTLVGHLGVTTVEAQGRGRGQAPAAANAQAAAPVDLTGYWVSLVTEDWRFRMVTPAKGDYSSVPLNAEGRRVADTWDPAKDKADGNACKAY